MAQEEQSTTRPSGVPNTSFSVLDLPAGTRVQLVNEATVEVVANPRDGMWIMVRYISSLADPSQEGAEELIFVEDIVAVLQP